MDRNVVATLYREGVSAIVAAGIDAQRWTRPACGKWTAADTARHVLAVARWYDSWLDRALTGDVSRPFAESALDERNDRELRGLRHVDGPEAIEGFEKFATAYLTRAVAHWDTPFSYPFGTVTVGLHLGVAATEWHLHAFDLARSANRTYSPNDPEALFLAAGACVVGTKPALQRAILRRLLPLGARRHPWTTILRQSGRPAA